LYQFLHREPNEEAASLKKPLRFCLLNLPHPVFNIKIYVVAQPKPDGFGWLIGKLLKSAQSFMPVYVHNASFADCTDALLFENERDWSGSKLFRENSRAFA